MGISKYSDEYNDFTRRLMEKCILRQPNVNIILSPLSILVLLTIAMEASSGDTKKEIEKLICGGTSSKEAITFLKKLQNELNSSNEVTIANAVVVDKTLRGSVNREFVTGLRKKYNGELFSSANVVKDVNSWVNEKTNGMIDRIADESMKEMVFCMLNAIVFEAEWKDEYNDTCVVEHEFVNVNGEKCDVSMLKSEEDYYVENSRCTGFVKAYKGDEFSFMALLPKNKKPEIPEEMLRKIDFTKLFRKKKPMLVYALLPEFKYGLTFDMKESLEEMGVKNAFSDGADFTPFSKEWLKLCEAIHKAYIEVDKNGTRAAAATMFGGIYGSATCLSVKYKEVYLDRPFVYAIIHNKTGIPVFAGVVNQLKPLSDKEIEDRYKVRVDRWKKYMRYVCADPMEEMDEESSKELKRRYRELARLIHPDSEERRNSSEEEVYAGLWNDLARAYRIADVEWIDELEKEIKRLRSVIKE